MKNDLYISLTLTTAFLAVSVFYATGCPGGFGGGSCDRPATRELPPGTFAAGPSNDERGSRYARASNLRMEIDDALTVVTIRYEDTDGRSVRETWSIDNLETRGRPPAPYRTPDAGLDADTASPGDAAESDADIAPDTPDSDGG